MEKDYWTSHELEEVNKRLERIESNVYGVEGTPTDCVMFALAKLLDRRPDWVLSGINRGSNIGQDTLYSGTVAAAMETCVIRSTGVMKTLLLGKGARISIFRPTIMYVLDGVVAPQTATASIC